MDSIATAVVLYGTAVTIAGAIVWRVIRAANQWGSLPARITRLEQRIEELEKDQDRHVRQYHRPRTRNDNETR